MSRGTTLQSIDEYLKLHGISMPSWEEMVFDEGDGQPYNPADYLISDNGDNLKRATYLVPDLGGYLELRHGSQEYVDKDDFAFGHQVLALKRKNSLVYDEEFNVHAEKEGCVSFHDATKFDESLGAVLSVLVKYGHVVMNKKDKRLKVRNTAYSMQDFVMDVYGIYDVQAFGIYRSQLVLHTKQKVVQVNFSLYNVEQLWEVIEDALFETIEVEVLKQVEEVSEFKGFDLNESPWKLVYDELSYGCNDLPVGPLSVLPITLESERWNDEEKEAVFEMQELGKNVIMRVLLEDYFSGNLSLPPADVLGKVNIYANMIEKGAATMLYNECWVDSVNDVVTTFFVTIALSYLSWNKDMKKLRHMIRMRGFKCYVDAVKDVEFLQTAQKDIVDDEFVRLSSGIHMIFDTNEERWILRSPRDYVKGRRVDLIGKDFSGDRSKLSGFDLKVSKSVEKVFKLMVTHFRRYAEWRKKNYDYDEMSISSESCDSEVEPINDFYDLPLYGQDLEDYVYERQMDCKDQSDLREMMNQRFLGSEVRCVPQYLSDKSFSYSREYLEKLQVDGIVTEYRHGYGSDCGVYSWVYVKTQEKKIVFYWDVDLTEQVLDCLVGCALMALD